MSSPPRPAVTSISAPGEFAASQLQIPIQREEVVLAYGSIDAKRVFEIPVESGVRTLTVFAGIQRKDLAVLVKPDGLVVHAGDPGAALQSFQHMLIATIDAPAPGIWKLELTGTGTFSVSAHVRPGDDGPQLDSVRSPCVVELSGAVREQQVEFVARDGATIGRAVAERCTVPKEPFRVAVSGVDASGRAFRRVERGLRTTAR